MKFLIVFAFAWTAVIGLPADKLKSRNIVVPAGTPEGRIVQGSKARPGQFPYQVYVEVEKGKETVDRCGGTLISHTDVITAAHCIEKAVKLRLFLGITRLDAAEAIYEVPIKNVVIHPLSNAETFGYDIAIIHIPHTPYSRNIQAAKLPAGDSANSTFVGEVAVALGWGRTSPSARSSTMDLQFAKFNVISDSVCSRTFTKSPSYLCVATHGRVTPCYGDSGGPLVLERSKTLIGVAAFVAKGCEAGKPAVFTRVTALLDWIHKNTKVSH